MAGADLIVRILGDSKSFDRTITSSKRQVSDFKKATESIAGSIGGLTKGLAAISGISFALS